MQRPASPPASGHGPWRGADPSPTVSWQIPRRRRRGVLAGVLLGLENTIRFTQRQGREVHYRTIEARDWLRSQGVKLPGEP